MADVAAKVSKQKIFTEVSDPQIICAGKIFRKCLPAYIQTVIAANRKESGA